MLSYRLYYFDQFSGHIDHFREFEAEDDAAATTVAQQWGTGAPMELWNRSVALSGGRPNLHQIEQALEMLC